MRMCKIPKSPGKFRVIYIPNAKEKQALQVHLPAIQRKAQQVAKEHVHGFVRGRSPVTAAKAHIGHQWTACFDLQDFFDSCNEGHVRKQLTKEQIAACFVDGAPRQGLMTSPAVANLAARSMDDAILKEIDKRQIIYTRYADDLTFSGDDENHLQWLLRELPKLVSRQGFKIAKHKTCVYRQRAGKRIVLGIAVGENDIQPTRRTKRRIRAALHQGNQSHARGLQEYAKNQEPRDKAHGECGDGIEAIAKKYKLGKIPIGKLPDKGQPVVDGAFLITGDPIYMLGMSTFTTGWTSCHRLTNGRKRGCVFWMFMRGTRLAAKLHENKEEAIAGNTRRLMRARCLVHQLRDGQMIYDRAYGEDAAKTELVSWLRAQGYKSVFEVDRGIEVVGHAPSRWAAWFDSLKSVVKTASSGAFTGSKVKVLKT